MRACVTVTASRICQCMPPGPVCGIHPHFTSRHVAIGLRKTFSHFAVVGSAVASTELTSMTSVGCLSFALSWYL